MKAITKYYSDLQLEGFVYIFTWFLILGLLGCSDDVRRTAVSDFTISNYEFEVYRVEVRNRKTNILERMYNDTILVNICDFIEECNEEDDIYIR